MSFTSLSFPKALGEGAALEGGARLHHIPPRPPPFWGGEGRGGEGMGGGVTASRVSLGPGGEDPLVNGGVYHSSAPGPKVGTWSQSKPTPDCGVEETKDLCPGRWLGGLGGFPRFSRGVSGPPLGGRPRSPAHQMHGRKRWSRSPGGPKRVGPQKRWGVGRCPAHGGPRSMCKRFLKATIIPKIWCL